MSYVLFLGQNINIQVSPTNQIRNPEFQQICKLNSTELFLYFPRKLQEKI